MSIYSKLFTSILLLIPILIFHPIEKDSEKQQMQLIKGGTFMMGESDGEGDERPVHEVTLSDFYIARYEVTVKEYRLFCNQTDREMPAPPKWGWIDKHPIINTTWYDANDYIKWYSEKSGKTYRLPTEAEFEYLIRNGGKPGKYPWKNESLIEENIGDKSFAKASGRSNVWNGYDDGFKYTSPVGSFAPNELGIYDINGNMWEWVSDWYGDYPDQAVTNPQGPESGTHKVGRGASYNADPWHVRTAGRNWVEPGFKGPTFRLAMDVVN